MRHAVLLLAFKEGISITTDCSEHRTSRSGTPAAHSGSRSQCLSCYVSLENKSKTVNKICLEEQVSGGCQKKFKKKLTLMIQISNNFKASFETCLITVNFDTPFRVSRRLTFVDGTVLRDGKPLLDHSNK